MASYAKKSIATLFASGILAVGVATPASADNEQNGVVNVGVSVEGPLLDVGGIGNVENED